MMTFEPPFKQTAVALLQWGPLHEPDEPHDAAEKLRVSLKEEAREDRTPHITTLRVTEPNPESALEALHWLLSTHRHLQVLYVSAHGSQCGKLCFDVEGNSSVDYAAFGRALSRGLTGLKTKVVLVMGACFALNYETQLQEQLPPEVLEVVGFTVTPTVADVSALIAAVLKSDEELLEAVSKSVAAAANDGEDVARAAEDALDSHQSRLARFVEGTRGNEIRHLHRDESGIWTGYTLKL